MNHNKHVAVIVSVLMLFTMLFVPPRFVVTAGEPFNNTENLGYELLDNGSVFHMWNNHNSYYFNRSNGVQFSNHYEEYWTHNVLMLGYYAGDTWSLLYRADELSGFTENLTAKTDEYINITLWKDLSYGGYDFRLALRYHLKVNDSELTIIPYIKNLGIAIPFQTGFGWEMKDIKIANVSNDNYLRIFNGTDFEDILLNQTVDRNFTDLNLNTSISLICTNPPSPYLSRNLYLRWNHTLNYKVTVKSRANQYNAPTTLFIRVGTLGVGQEKSTKMNWLDSEEPEPEYSIITYGGSWIDYEYEDGTHSRTLYMGDMFTEELDGKWYTLPEVSNIAWNNGVFNFSYRDYWVHIEPFVVYNGNNYTIQEIKNVFPNIDIKDYITFGRFNHKFALNFSNVPQNLIDNTDYIGFRLKEVHGLTWDDVQKTNNHTIVIKNKVGINYYDLIKSNFTLSMPNKRTLLIGNISNNSANGVICLDPSIELQVGTGANDGFLEDDGIWSTTTYMDVGKYTDIKHAWYLFTAVTIPSGATITSANISLYGQANYGSALTKIYAEDTETPSVPTSWANYLAKSLTSEYKDWDGTITADVWNACPDISNIIQELVTSYSYSSGSIQILHKDDGSANANMWRMDTYETSTTLAPYLKISYTVPNNAPTIAGEIPANQSTCISLTPVCNVTANDEEGGDTLTVTFYENTTGSWVLQQTNSSISPGTNVIWNNYNNASSYGTKYWWAVNVSDGTDYVNETYHFTTMAIYANLTIQTLKDEYSDSDTYINITDPPDTDTFNITNDALDGNVQNANGVYQPVHDNSTGYFSSTTNTVVGQEYQSGPHYWVVRGLLRFDASALPDNAVITGAKLKLYVKVINCVDDFVIKIQKWTEAPAISNEDYDAFDGVSYDDGNFNTTDLSEVAYNDIIFSDFSVISKTGYTDLMLRSSRDISSTAPTAMNLVNFQDVADGNPPKLEVTWEPPDYPMQSGELPTNGTISAPYSTSGVKVNVTITDDEGDPMDITFRTNASGSWMDIDTNTSCNNGSYSQWYSGFDTRAVKYWWSANVTDNKGNWTNATYHFTIGYVESKIDATNSCDITGYLLMQLEYNNSGTWQLEDIIVNETSPTTITGGTELKLDAFWNGNCTISGNISSGTGHYRIYAAFRYANWSVIKCEDDSYINGTWEFNYTASEFLWLDVTNVSWALGTIATNAHIYTNETGKTFICDMDNTTVNTDLSLQITTDGATWHDGATPAGDIYRINVSIDTWIVENLLSEASDTTISSDITAYQNETFDLRFDAPTSTSTGVQQTITITATIVKH